MSTHFEEDRYNNNNNNNNNDTTDNFQFNDEDDEVVSQHSIVDKEAPTKITAMAATLLQWIIFLFVLVAMPIDYYRASEKVTIMLPTGPMQMRMCFSMWGMKQCGAHDENPFRQQWKGFPCTGVLYRMNAAGGFAIFSIFSTMFCGVASLFLLAQMSNKPAAVLGILSFITMLVSWSCAAGAFHYKCSFPHPLDGSEVKKNIHDLHNVSLYGGFWLMITAWILQLINIILFFVA